MIVIAQSLLEAPELFGDLRVRGIKGRMKLA